MDQIRIDNLMVFAHHGVFPEETQTGQHFYINVILYTDTGRAGFSDDLSDSTHYGEVALFIHQFLTEHTYQLLEAAAEHLAQALLLQYPLVEALELELKKPEAPIPLTFDSVSVKIQRGWHTAFISIGSNMGEREDFLHAGIRKIASHPLCSVVSESDLIRTPPYGMTQQEDFLNGCIEVKTLLTPEELLTVMQEAEREAGRERKVHWGPRTLDLDLIYYDDRVIFTERLLVPHTDMQNRVFVLKPLAQIAPFVLHPLLHKTAGQLLLELTEKEGKQGI